jgi:glycosyltransferase involved in cell wall biosynthesis
VARGVRVLIGTMHRDLMGGAETYVRLVLPLLAGRGHAPALLHQFDSRPGGLALDEGAALEARISVQSSGEDGAVEAARAFRPDVIYQQGLVSPGLEARLMELAPAVFFAHGYSGTCVSGTKRFAVPRLAPCSRTLGVGCLVHYPLRRCGGLSLRTMGRQYAVQTARRALLRRYRAVAVASEHMAREVSRHGAVAKVVRVPPAWAPMPEPPAPRAQTGVVLFAGRLTREKGLRELARAVERAARELGRRLVLRVAGSGPEEAWLRARPATGLSRIDCLGWLTQDVVKAEMQAADVLGMPSVWPEPFGLSGIEAGGVGLPAVAYPVGGIPEWLEAGVGGELAEGSPASVRGLAAALVRALKDPERWQALRHGAWRSAHRFSATAHLDALEPVLLAAATSLRLCPSH